MMDTSINFKFGETAPKPAEKKMTERERLQAQLK